MTTWRRRARAVALFGAAAVGLLIAHELDYRFVVPDPAHRHDLLLRSGHGYLGHALAVGVLAGVIAAVTAVALGFVRGRRSGASTSGVRTVALRLALVQSGGFVLLEAVERLLVGSPPGDRLLLITGIGVLVQVATALGGAMLLALLERVGAAIASLTGARPIVQHASRGWVPSVCLRVEPLCFDDTRSARGPPLLVR